MQDKKNLLIIAAVVIVVVAALILWFYQTQRTTAPQGPSTAGAPPGAGEPKTLGEEIFEKSQNPVADKLQTVNPAGRANPLEGVYKNPFE